MKRRNLDDFTGRSVGSQVIYMKEEILQRFQPECTCVQGSVQCVLRTAHKRIRGRKKRAGAGQPGKMEANLQTHRRRHFSSSTHVVERGGKEPVCPYLPFPHPPPESLHPPPISTFLFIHSLASHTLCALGPSSTSSAALSVLMTYCLDKNVCWVWAISIAFNRLLTKTSLSPFKDEILLLFWIAIIQWCLLDSKRLLIN